MADAAFLADLARYGPNRSHPGRITLDESRAYCRRLARRHYENFSVASWLLPRRLRQHFFHLYAYCRWSDDLADETGNPQRSLALLDWWEVQLRGCYAGEVTHPVFVALAETIHEFSIPIDPFLDLLSAFRRDQWKTRYQSVDELIDYCRLSANPVGRLVLYVGACHDDARRRLSDSICTGLQLANFWQDIARDWDLGRIYLPQEEMQEFGCDEACFSRREASPEFRRALAAQVDRAEQSIRAGLPLVERVPGELKIDVELFARGGLAILDGIRRMDFDVWRRRPAIGRLRQLRLLAGCWWRTRKGSRSGDAP